MEPLDGRFASDKIDPLPPADAVHHSLAAAAVAWLANTLGEYGVPLKAGEIILSGSLVPLEPAAPGDTFRMDIPGLGQASISFA